MIDLDRIEAVIKRNAPDPSGFRFSYNPIEMAELSAKAVPALLAELRAARAVVHAAKNRERSMRLCDGEIVADNLKDALSVYDQAAEGVKP